MKKALASLLAAGMAASLLAGCGGSSSTAASTADTSTAASTEASSTAESDAPLEGEITFWHSFTQGARMEAVQNAADKFMEANPGVKINIETYFLGRLQHQVECRPDNGRPARYEHGSGYR